MRRTTPAAAVGKDAAQSGLAYMEFRHNKDHNHLRAPLKQAPAKISTPTKEPTGGKMRSCCANIPAETWGEPIAITEPGGDLYRPAVTVDGSGKPWVFWSANEERKFRHLGADPVDNGDARDARAHLL